MALTDGFPADERAGVPDCTLFPDSFSPARRLAILAASALAGAGAGLALAGDGGAVWGLLGAAALAGGLLSTWSPCGYSSISLLRPNGRTSLRSVAGWLPTFAMHGAGYALGALILGTALGASGALLGFAGFGTLALAVLALVGLAYGAHQLDFLRVPYPQRRAQVPHDARQRFPKWVVGGIYGLSLGLDYLTYVQTPLLYLVTLAAAFTGNIAEAIALIALFNLGRFLPVAVNALPIPDHAIQGWLARNQERAAMVDGAILIALGAAFGVFALT